MVEWRMECCARSAALLKCHHDRLSSTLQVPGFRRHGLVHVSQMADYRVRSAGNRCGVGLVLAWC